MSAPGSQICLKAVGSRLVFFLFFPHRWPRDDCFASIAFAPSLLLPTFSVSRMMSILAPIYVYSCHTLPTVPKVQAQTYYPNSVGHVKVSGALTTCDIVSIETAPLLLAQSALAKIIFPGDRPHQVLLLTYIQFNPPKIVDWLRRLFCLFTPVRTNISGKTSRGHPPQCRLAWDSGAPSSATSIIFLAS